ncbi:hypothetical protein [Actinoplanes friuliensis]|uniref:Uncharacterized protein n=1 Tax=Actinoplanes friuliensis DSM 7358 TaxID=1246995 RepID=U5W3Y9_9ACTN|nr:hypothetical protein [Actinoplanes friuliensis]AGZ43849.1 hypothetical protein AFR_27940 [Actinoplanes friuliensis DSM 7358]
MEEFVTGPGERGLTMDRVMSHDGPERPLLEAASRAARGRSCDDLNRVPVLGRHGSLPDSLRRHALAHLDRAEAVPLEQLPHVDAASVAAWIAEHYPAGSYPGVVIGSAHGGAVHLAAALGAAWLPTTFTVTVPRDDSSAGDWAGAMAAGATAAGLILARNPQVSVRQVHDPVRRGPLCGSTITLHVRWRQLPPAYRHFLRTRLDPGAPVLLLRDTRSWPVVEPGPGHSFQLGSPASGLAPEQYSMEYAPFRRLMYSIGEQSWPVPGWNGLPRYAELAGEPELDRDLRRLCADSGRPVHRALYRGPDALSSCVADLYRRMLAAAGRNADRCVIESGRLVDPWRVLKSGLVPFWCEFPSRAAVDAAEWWLAGSAPFDSVTGLPEAPGTVCDTHADVAQWRAVSRFARHRPDLSRQAMGRYPLLPLATSHASTVIRGLEKQSPDPDPLTMPDVVTALRQAGSRLGFLVG